MTSRHTIVCAAIALAFAGSAFADPPTTVYVTTGVGAQVVAIPLDPVTGVQNGPAQILVTSELALTDVTVKSDGVVHYATTKDIRRVGNNASVAVVAGVQELRFSAFNCLFYNSSGGVNSVACGNPGQTSGAGGKGLAFDLFGQLLAISGNTVIRIPLTTAGNKGTPTTLVGSGLTAPAGLAVAAGEGANGLERGDFAVADGRHVRLYDKTGALLNAEYASVPEGQTINFMDFDADDRLWLATMVSNAGTTEPNGRVYHADAGGAVCADSGGSDCTLAAQVFTNKYWPAVGLALGTSRRHLSQTIEPGVQGARQTFKFDFGSSIVQIEAVVIDTCELRVDAGNRLAQDAVALVGSSQYSLDPYLGEEGFPTVYHIQSRKNGEEVDASACVDVSPASKPFVFIAAMTSTGINPRILRCDGECEEAELIGWWSTGPIEGDAEGGGRADDWSDWLIVEKALAPPSEQVRFCGFGPPLAGGRSQFAPGAHLTVQAQFSAPGQSCSSGLFLTDPDARFLIALARILPTHERKNLIGESGEPPIMHLVGNAYELPLTLEESNGTDYAPGTYEITLSDVTAGGTRLRSVMKITFKIVAQ